MRLMIRHASLVALALAATAISARAQSFNIDIGNQPPFSPIPSSLYGAGASQPGFWNSVLPTIVVPVPLNDINGVLTGVSLAVNGGLGIFNVDNPSTIGDDGALLDDCQQIGSSGTTTTWTFANLAGGDYRLTTYAWNPNDPFARTSVAAGAVTPAQPCGGFWPGALQQGVTHTLHHLPVFTGGQIQVTITTTLAVGTVNGFQLLKIPPPGQAFCFGDGSGTPCPMGNPSPVGDNSGCLNSLGVGAILEGVGNPSISADTLVFRGSRMPFGPCLYFQGNSLVGGGSGAAFGNGLRCATGAVVRLSIKFNGHGSSVYPAAGDPPVSQGGGVSTPGFKYYQVWYRDAASPPSNFNLSQTVCIPWVP